MIVSAGVGDTAVNTSGMTAAELLQAADAAAATSGEDVAMGVRGRAELMRLATLEPLVSIPARLQVKARERGHKSQGRARRELS